MDALRRKEPGTGEGTESPSPGSRLGSEGPGPDLGGPELVG